MAFEIHTDGLLNIINSDLCNFDLVRTRTEKMRLHLPKERKRHTEQTATSQGVWVSFVNLTYAVLWEEEASPEKLPPTNRPVNMAMGFSELLTDAEGYHPLRAMLFSGRWA